MWNMGIKYFDSNMPYFSYIVLHIANYDTKVSKTSFVVSLAVYNKVLVFESKLKVWRPS